MLEGWRGGRGGSTSTSSATVTTSTSPRAFSAKSSLATTSAEEGGDAVAAGLAAGAYRSLRSRELNEALQYLGSGPHWRAVYDVFDSLCAAASANEEGARTPNAYVATTVLSIAGRRGDLDRVRRTFEWMQAQGPGRSAPTAHTYTAYIQAAGNAGEWREAFSLFNEMRIGGVRPTSHTYSALIRAGAKGGRVGARAAVGLVEDMRTEGLTPDVPIASALISAYGVLGQFANAEKMLKAAEAAMVAEAKKANASGGEDRAGTSGGSTGRRDGEVIGAPPRSDPKLYTEFLIAACRCGRPEVAAEVFESANFPRTSYTCTAAIKAYGECQQWEKAEELYQSMARGGFMRGMAPTGITHTALLSAYEKCGQWQRAVAFLTQLKEKEADVGTRSRVKEIHYNITMSACGKCGEWARAERLFDEMVEHGVSPSTVTYSTLIAAYGHAGEEARANARFSEMLKRTDPVLAPDDYTCVGLMLAPAGRGDVHACLEIKRRMSELGVAPTVHVYNELIRAAEVAKRYELAVEIFQKMQAKGVEPNATTSELLKTVGKKGVEYYEDQQLAANFGTLVAGLVGVAGMMAGRW